MAVSIVIGLALLYISGDIIVENLILLARYFGVSMFNIGFIVSSIGSDIPEIVNGVFSALIDHGGIAVGNTIGSANAQLLLILGVMPFFCTFCRLIPRPFAVLGATEVGILTVAVVLSLDGTLSRLDGVLLVLLWFFSIWVIRRFGGRRYAEEESESPRIASINKPWTALGIVLSFIGVGIGSYLVVESAIMVSGILGVSEFFISFFALSIGTSLPEFVVAMSSIRKRYYELAIGDIVGSCIVDITLAMGFSALVNPLRINVREVRLIGSYSILLHIVAVSVLAYRGVNDKKTGGLLIALYLSSWILPFLL